MNYHKLKLKLNQARDMKDLHCSEHCHCKNPDRRTDAASGREDMLTDLRHGNKIAISIDLAESILRDLETLVP